MKSHNRRTDAFGVVDQLLESGLDVAIGAERLSRFPAGGDPALPGDGDLFDLGPVGVGQGDVPAVTHRMDEFGLGEETLPAAVDDGCCSGSCLRNGSCRAGRRRGHRPDAPPPE